MSKHGTSEEVFPIDENDDDVMVTIDLDDGDTLDCEIMTIFTLNDKDYIVLLPVDENGEPYDDTVYIYRYYEDANGLPSVEYIADEDEYEAAADRYDEMLDEAFYDSIED